MNCPVIDASSIIEGDSEELIGCMPSGSVDLIVTDPPYGIEYSTGHRKDSFIKGSDGIACDTDDCIIPKMERMVDEMDRILKPDSHVYMFTKWNKIPDFLPVLERKFNVKNILIWDKLNWSMGDIKGAYAGRYEPVIFAHKGRRELNCIDGTCRHSDIIKFNRVSGKKQKHSHQKPEKLIDFLIRKSSNDGDIVFDPFLGTGTTCSSAVKNGRKCIGMEIDGGTFDIAIKKLEGRGITIKRNGSS